MGCMSGKTILVERVTRCVLKNSRPSRRSADTADLNQQTSSRPTHQALPERRVLTCLTGRVSDRL